MNWLHSARRDATRRATLAALDLAGRIGCARVLSLGVASARFAHLLPFARQRLADNLRAAGVDSSDATVRAYFRRFGVWAGQSMGVFAAGLDQSLAAGQIDLNPETVGRLDEAVARGRGVVLASPHMFCHEIGAGLIHRRHPVAALVRESKAAGWGRVKDQWYGTALGIGTVLRPRKGSAAGDVGAMLRTLRAGTILGITPDVLTARTSGMPVTMFGRRVSLSPGMILLGMRSGAPLITARFRWSPDPTLPGQERLRISFTEPLHIPRSGDREADLRAGLQRWCDQFEAALRRSPADWLFWLDKAWTKVLRQSAGERAA
jgi:lauroyl/myristoyl acyltransferase